MYPPKSPPCDLRFGRLRTGWRNTDGNGRCAGVCSGGLLPQPVACHHLQLYFVFFWPQLLCYLGLCPGLFWLCNLLPFNWLSGFLWGCFMKNDISFWKNFPWRCCCREMKLPFLKLPLLKSLQWHHKGNWLFFPKDMSEQIYSVHASALGRYGHRLEGLLKEWKRHWLNTHRVDTNAALLVGFRRRDAQSVLNSDRSTPPLVNRV